MKSKNDKLPQPDENQPQNTKNQFTEFYEKNVNWMDGGDGDPMVGFRNFYSDYFKENEPDYERLKSGLIDTKKPTKKSGPNKAPEVFKALFKLPYKTTQTIETHDLTQIEKTFGAEIIAHGVEEAKGGMHNLLLMCISNQVRAPAGYWGPFKDGMPNMSPLSHGPYYLIHAMPSKPLTTEPNNPLLTDIACILVPFKENRDILLEQMQKMAQVNLVTPERTALIGSKIITYSEFLKELQAQAQLTQSPSKANRCGFFAPTANAQEPTDEGSPNEKRAKKMP